MKGANLNNLIDDNAVNLIEKLKNSFFYVDNITGLININLIAFILLTTSALLFITEKYFIRKFKTFYPEDDEDIKTKGLYSAYDIIKHSLLYISLILMSVILIHRRVWSAFSDSYIEIFSIPMLIGFIILILSIIINYIKRIDIKLRTYIYNSGLIVGYLIYGLGFIMGMKLI